MYVFVSEELYIMVLNCVTGNITKISSIILFNTYGFNKPAKLFLIALFEIVFLKI